MKKWLQTTLSGRRRRIYSKHVYRWMPIALLTSVALAIGLLATQSLVSEYFALSAKPTLSALRQGKRVDQTSLQSALEAQTKVLMWRRSARNLTDLGLIQLSLSKIDGQAAPARRRLLLLARQSTRQGLKIGPGNPFAWSRLAYIQLRLTGPSRKVVDYVLMSIRTGTYERRLHLSRGGMLFLLRDLLSPVEAVLAREEVRRGWRISRFGIAELAYEAGATTMLFNSIGDGKEVGRALDAVRRSF